MDPRRVLTFRAVAHERSFCAAARALSLTQPAVSQQVAALEREVGARLLDREPGGLALTPRRARSCSSTPTRSPSGFELADAAARASCRASRARLRIGAFPSALAALVPAGRAPPARDMPDVEVLVEEGDSQALAERVRARRAAPRASRSRTPRCRAREHEGLERHDLLREPFLVALPPGHRARRARDDRARRPRRTPRGSRRLDRRADRPRLPRRGLRAAPRLDHARPARDPRARRPRHSRSRSSRACCADGFRRRRAARRSRATARSATSTSLLPPGGRHPLVEPTLERAGRSSLRASHERPPAHHLPGPPRDRRRRRGLPRRAPARTSSRSDQHSTDPEGGEFFMRMEFTPRAGRPRRARQRASQQEVAERLDMR